MLLEQIGVMYSNISTVFVSLSFMTLRSHTTAICRATKKIITIDIFHTFSNEVERGEDQD